MSVATNPRWEGRAEGPVQQRGEVVDRRRVGRYWALTVTAGEIARRAVPGQFVNVEVRGFATMLRRPFSIAGCSIAGPVAGTVDVLFDVHGPGTEALSSLRTGDHLAVLGPLGRGFPMPQRRVSALLVGGGYGAAPLYWLGERLRAQGHRIGFVLGAADQQRLVDPIVPKRMATFTEFTTEDGSTGTRGRVTDVLPRALQVTGAEVVYACGPNAMLAAVSAACASRDLPCQVAVEEHMACGVGVCMTCVLPVRDRHGTVHNRRACTDGPVFTSTRVAWDQSRYGLTGAPPQPPVLAPDVEIDDRIVRDQQGGGMAPDEDVGPDEDDEPDELEVWDPDAAMHSPNVRIVRPPSPGTRRATMQAALGGAHDDFDDELDGVAPPVGDAGPDEDPA